MCKKLLAILLVITMLSGVLFCVHAEEVPAQISIDRTFLMAGQTLTVDNPGGYTLHFFVDDEEKGTDSYTPSEEDYEKWITVKAYDGDTEASQDKVYFSKLPVLYINTEDGQPVTQKIEYKPAAMMIQNNTESSAVVYDGAIKIKGRGNSTWGWPKKPYRIKLDKKTDLFGMGKSKNWVLLANYLDECSMRYSTAVRLSKEMGLTTMDCVWTDVVLNGEYVGMYQLCENISIAKDRVDIFDWEEEAKNVASAVAKAEKKKGNVLDKDALEDALTEDLSWITSGTFLFEGNTYTVSDYYQVSDDITKGYLFEISNNMDEVSCFTTDRELCVMMKSPEYLNTNETMMNYAETFWQNFEDAYTSDDGYVQTEEGMKHYSEFADIDSMIDYWLVMEILGNVDAAWRSRFAFIDSDGLLHFGPVWDFDWGSGSLTVTIHALGWQVTNGAMAQRFFREFVDDPYFLSKASDRYWEIRPYLYDLVKDGGLLDQDLDYIREAGIADERRWDRRETWPDKARGFLTDAQMYKNAYLKNRFKWLDKQFASDETLIESIRSEYSASPYYKDDQLGISMSKVHPVNSKYAPPNGAIGVNDSVKVNLCAKDDETESVNVYLNGLFYQSIDLSEEKKASFTIDSDSLNSELHKKNVISVVGKDSENRTTRRNFITVWKSDTIPANQKGDIDLDGSISIKDATVLQKHLCCFLDAADVELIDEADAKSMEIADIDGNGKLNIKDVTALQRYLTDFEEW